MKFTLTRHFLLELFNLRKTKRNLDNKMNSSNSSVNEDVKNLLNFAGGIISARDRVHLQMSEHRLGVFRQEIIDGLVGLSIGGIEDEWLRIKRQKPTEPNLPPDYIKEFIKFQKAWDPINPPSLHDAISKTVSTYRAVFMEERSSL